MKQFTDQEKLSMFDSIYEKWNCETKSAIEFMKERDLAIEKSLYMEDLLFQNDQLRTELAQYTVFIETPLSIEYKERLEEMKARSTYPVPYEMDTERAWLINRVEQGVFYHAHAEHEISILNKVKKFADNEYLKDVESTTDFRGGYAACLKDLKGLLK